MSRRIYFKCWKQREDYNAFCGMRNCVFVSKASIRLYPKVEQSRVILFWSFVNSGENTEEQKERISGVISCLHDMRVFP